MTPARKKNHPIEYRMLIAPHFNERTQKQTTLVILETSKSFASFQYEISVRQSKEHHKLSYKILGLRAPRLSLPAAGHAHFEMEYDDLAGSYELEIEGLDGTVNMFAVTISPRKVELLKAPPKRFIDVVVDKKHWNID